MDRNWDQDHFNTRDLDKIVVRIHVCAYVNESNAGDEEGNPPTNHWAIFLELADQNSVRLDMAPGYGSDGLRGKIEVASKRYQMTMNAIYSLSFDVAPGVTVRTSCMTWKRLELSLRVVRHLFGKRSVATGDTQEDASSARLDRALFASKDRRKQLWMRVGPFLLAS